MLGCLLLGAVTARAPVDIIVDTDLSIDVDDVGAMCVAHALVDRGEARLLAVIHDTALPEGVGAVSVINEYYGRQIPLGAYRGRVGAPGSDLAQPGWTNQGRGRYVDSLLSEFASPVRHASEVADAVTVYREALNRAKPASVTIVAIGFATTLLELLASTADVISPLSGVELVAERVQRLVIMGGRHAYDPAEEPVEWNFGGCGVGSEWNDLYGPTNGCGSYDELGTITQQMLERWPVSVPITFVGFEAGVDVRTGLLQGKAATPATHSISTSAAVAAAAAERARSPCRRACALNKTRTRRGCAIRACDVATAHTPARRDHGSCAAL